MSVSCPQGWSHAWVWVEINDHEQAQECRRCGHERPGTRRDLPTEQTREPSQAPSSVAPLGIDQSCARSAPPTKKGASRVPTKLEVSMDSVKELILRANSGAMPQADGDPGIHSGGLRRSAWHRQVRHRYHGESNAEFSESMAFRSARCARNTASPCSPSTGRALHGEPLLLSLRLRGSRTDARGGRARGPQHGGPTCAPDDRVRDTRRGHRPCDGDPMSTATIEMPIAIEVGWHYDMSMEDYLDIGRPVVDPETGDLVECEPVVSGSALVLMRQVRLRKSSLAKVRHEMVTQTESTAAQKLGPQRTASPSRSTTFWSATPAWVSVRRSRARGRNASARHRISMSTATIYAVRTSGA